MTSALHTMTITELEVEDLQERIAAVEAGLAEQARLLDEERADRALAERRFEATLELVQRQVRGLVDQALDEHLRRLAEALARVEAR